MWLWRKFKDTERAWRSQMGEDISTPATRRRAWRHYLFIDHGVLRVWWRNFHKIDDGVYRSNQPSPRRLEQFRDMGIKTVLNLRGKGEHSHYLFEKEACEKLGLTLIDHTLYASDLASPQELLALATLFETIEKPFVMHCKSGADRTGLAAVMYLVIVKEIPIEQAMDQLNWRYIHFRKSKNGILDFLFEAYQNDLKTAPISLLDWIKTKYDPVELRAKYFGNKKF